MMNYILEAINECQKMEDKSELLMTQGWSSKTPRTSSRNKGGDFCKNFASCEASPTKMSNRSFPHRNRLNEEHYLIKLEKWLKDKLNTDQCHRGTSIT